MAGTQPESRKHHFVPRSLLRYFRPTDDVDYLYAFDKRSGRVFRTSLMNAGSENGFNTYKDGEDIINFEQDFDEVDALLANRLREIHSTRNVSLLSAEQRRDWADLAAAQLTRTPIVRSTMTVLLEDLRNQVEEKFGTKLEIQIPSENDARRSARGLFKDREDARQALIAKDIVLFEALGDTPFRISDRPVTLQSTLPFGDTGLTSHGVAVFMPLGQRLMLGLLCPSIGRKLNKFSLEKLGLPDEDARARLIALRDGLATGTAVDLDEEMVKRHNDQQIAGSTRFVYGPTNNFEDAQTLVSAHPEVREVRSSINLGELGNGPGPSPNMPPGSWLVLFGRSEAHMLQVRDVSDTEPLEVTVQSMAAFAAVLKDGPFSEMRYYVDKSCRRSMRDVRLVQLRAAGGRRVQVRHANPGLDTLMKSIGSRSK